MFQFHPVAVPLLLTTLFSAITVGLIWRKALDTQANRPTPNHAHVLVMGLITIWAAGQVLAVIGVSYAVKLMGLYLTIIATPWTAVTWFLFVLFFTGRRDWITRRRVAALVVFPVIATVGVATNEVTNLFLVHPSLDSVGDRTVLSFGWGIGTWATALHSWILAGIAFVFLLQLFRASRNIYRKIAFLHLAGATALCGGPVLSLSGQSPFRYLVLSVIAFLAIVILSALAAVSYRTLRLLPLERLLAVFAGRFQDLSPMARDTIIQTMQSGVLVLDGDNRIVDVNPMGKRMLGAEDRQIVGKDLTEVLPPELFESEDLPFLDPATTEGVFRGIWVETAAGERYCFDLQVSGLGPGEGTGRTCLFNDVTDRERRKERLEDRNQEIDLLRQVQSRILRHNIRNDLTVIRGRVEELAAKVDDGDTCVTEVRKASDDLLSISQKARLVEQVVNRRTETIECDLREVVDHVVSTVEGAYPDVDIQVTGPASCPVEAAPEIDACIENLLENAVEHNDSREPEVTVRLTDSPPPTLSIADNGPGIPKQEIGVLENQAESSLEHGSGIGLWLVKWIADRSGTELVFDSSPEGTVVTLRFERGRTVDRPERVTATETGTFT